MIFDCDGVLVDSERLAIEVEVGILADVGWELTSAEIVERFVGISDADYVALIEDHIGKPLPPTWEADMEPRYREAFEASLEPVQGITDALDALDRAGVATCVASSGTHEKMRFTLGKTGLFDRFEGRIFSATEVDRGKPAPDLFLHAAARMGIAPTHCAVVEDSPPGVAGALAAGMRAIAYGGGVVPVERLLATGNAGESTGPARTVEIVDDMRRLPAMLGIPGFEQGAQ